jgi:TolB-like protein/cytochrome c-type biogenesis protein CcmH/NrfG
MAEGDDEKASGITPIIFISYASQDADAAQSICQTLRAAGIAVWFDQSELRGGDVWDQSIRKQIRACALFLPVISRHTRERDEGYFRLEWKLAVDRSHYMTGNKAFLLPVVIDDTRDDDENVPYRFREVQWTRLPAGKTPPAFVQRVQRLMLSQPLSTSHPATSAAPRSPAIREPLAASWWSKGALLGIVTLLAAASAYLLVERPWSSKHLAAKPVTATASALTVPATTGPFAPPPHSIAVLPFVNMSGDKQQEYFSDGLTEELLNSLTAINELQVAARTSAFSFKGKDTDIGTIARKLNVGAVLEGSVRRSSHTLRITAQLINSVTGFQLWSKTYDRDLGDVLRLQTQIASAVADALKVTLLADAPTKIELGGTRNPAAFDAYLRASEALNTYHNPQDLQTGADAFTQAIRLDPAYALAFAGRSRALGSYAAFAVGPAQREALNNAISDARQSIALAPDLPAGHLALGLAVGVGSLDFKNAMSELQRALTLAPGDARILRTYGLVAVYMGRVDAGITAARRAVVLDPLNRTTHYDLGEALFYARRYGESVVALQHSLTIDPNNAAASGYRGLSYYALGDFQGARSMCEVQPAHWVILHIPVEYERGFQRIVNADSS